MLRSEEIADLAHHLRREGYQSSLDQILAAHEVIRETSQWGSTPTSLIRLTTLLRPIFCSTPEEQERFDQLYREWLRARGGTRLPKPPEPPDTIPPPVPEPQFSPNSVKPTVAGLLILLPLITWFLWLDPSALDPIREYKALVTIVIVFSLLAWLFYWLRSRVVLNRQLSQIQQALDQVQVSVDTRHIFPSLSMRHVTQRLRQRRFEESTELDVRRTIHHTIHRGGLFTPVFGSMRELGYVSLIDCSTVADHQAKLPAQVVKDLARGNVLVRQYEFDEQPTILGKIDPLRTEPIHSVDVASLGEVAAKFPTSRLLCFADSMTCFDPLTGKLRPWVKRLEAWEERFLFTTRTDGQWKQAERILSRRGFHVLPLTSLGLRRFSQLVVPGRPPAATADHDPREPWSTYDRTPHRWLERHPPSPDTIKDLMDDLAMRLKSDGILWLAACAVHQEIYWDLTLEWGCRLFGWGQTVETLLPKLMPLVWFRHAFMPDWFRTALYDQLDETAVQLIRQNLIEIHEETRKSLPRRKSPETTTRSPMHDDVMQQYLSGKQEEALAPDVLKTLPDFLLRKAQSSLEFLRWDIGVRRKPQRVQFHPPFLLRNAHLMTLVPRYLPRDTSLVGLPQESRFFAVEPDAQLLGYCHWQGDRTSSPTVILVHGLEGSSDSRYMRGIAAKAYRSGFNVIRMNQRTCGGTEHLSPTLYNSGLSGDYRAIVRELAERDGLERIWLVGYSMGGNLVLKVAGELGQTEPALAGVAAVCPNIDPTVCARALEEPRNWIYHRHFLTRLKSRLRRKAALLPGKWDLSGLDQIATISEFDDRYTAPDGGYRDGADYYDRAGARHVINSITVPTLIITAQDDPFIPYSMFTIPSIQRHPHIRLKTPRYGGHCQFFQSSQQGEDRYWAENRNVDFLLGRL